MVITVEPGIYIEEEGFGIRIEDDVAVRLFGCEILTHYPKELKDAIIHCDIPEFFDEVNIGIKPTDVLELDSDGKTNCSIIIDNPSNMRIGVSLAISNVPKGWSVDFISNLTVGANSRTSENLRIRAPEDFDGVKTIDLTFSYYVVNDPYIKGTPLSLSLTTKSSKIGITDFEPLLPVVLIILLIVAIAIILFLKRKN